MASVMKRKTYGYVKPVKQAKPQPKYAKPSSVELRSLYTGLSKSPSHVVLDMVSLALQWYDRMNLFRAESQKHGVLRTDVARFTLQAKDSRSRAWSGRTNEEKVNNLIQSLQFQEKIMDKVGIKVPKISVYLKKGKSFSSKFDTNVKKLEIRFDSVLTLLAQAIPNSHMEFGVVPDMRYKIAGAYLSRRYDHTLNKMLYSRTHVLQMKKKIRRDGLLPVLLSEIFWISRAMSCKTQARSSGRFIPDYPMWVTKTYNMLTDVVEFAATHPEAPSTLVRRKAPRKKRARKIPSPFPVDHTDSVIL